MSEPSSVPSPAPPEGEGSVVTPDRPEEVRRPGEPARPGSSEGRARSFREREAQRRSLRRERIGVLVVVVVIVLGVCAIVFAKSFSPSSRNNFPTPGPPINVTLSTPIVSTVSCGGGGTAFTERITWANATSVVVTGDVNLKVYELWDGDYLLGANVVANVTSSSLCAGSPPAAEPQYWYVVFAAPNGTTLLTYTVTGGWAAISHGNWNIPIENGSVMTVVSGVSLAGRPTALYGLALVGFANGSPVRGSVPL